MTDLVNLRISPLSVDVSAELPFDGAYAITGWLLSPDGPVPGEAATILYCLSGGGQAVSTFDLDVPGFQDLSFARFMAARGYHVAAFDHPGVGTSTPVPDLYALDVGAVARAHARAVRVVTAHVAPSGSGRPRVIGIGHSLGGMVAAVMQAREAAFDAVVALGHGGGGLPEVLTAPEMALAGASGPSVDEALQRLARARFGPESWVPKRGPSHGTFFGDDVPTELIEAMADHRVELLYSCALQTLIPGSIAADMGAIDVPVFLGFGEHDIIGEPHAVVAAYRRATDVTLFVLAGAGHCQLQAGNRRVLWERIGSWVATVAAPPRAP